MINLPDSSRNRVTESWLDKGAAHRGWRMAQIFKRRLAHWAKSREISAPQSQLSIQLFAHLQQFQIRIAHCADDELAHNAELPLLLLANLADPFEPLHQFVPEVFLGR